jgi:hypothetical protein
VDRVGWWLDEEDAEAGVVAEQPREQVLVPPPDAVPRLERDDDQVSAHRTLR